MASALTNENIMETLVLIAACVVWFYFGGSLFVAAPAFYVSDWNLGIHYAENDGRPTRWLKISRNIFIAFNACAYIGGYILIFKFL